MGADDYLTKPFSPRELVLRVDAILRRARADGVAPPKGDAFSRRDRYASILAPCA